VNDVKQRQRQAWQRGLPDGWGEDSDRSDLCEAVDLRGGQTVLDVATGTGNTAMLPRVNGARCGDDYVPSLLEIGRVRAAAKGPGGVSRR
jgi:ubiquinone/menaquinone biosynthesis C-methylase UbiE